MRYNKADDTQNWYNLKWHAETLPSFQKWKEMQSQKGEMFVNGELCEEIQLLKPHNTSATRMSIEAKRQSRKQLLYWCQKCNAVCEVFRPTWPYSGYTYCVQNIWEEIDSAENYKKKWNLILTWVILTYKVMLCNKYVCIVIVCHYIFILLIFGCNVLCAVFDNGV